jgi:hypothetical protein
MTSDIDSDKDNNNDDDDNDNNNDGNYSKKWRAQQSTRGEGPW